MDSPAWQRIFNSGARRQRLLWASTGTKDPQASDILYVHALASPFTVNTMPEATLKALADHGEIGQTLPAHARYCDEVLAKFAGAGIDTDALATQLQEEGAKGFVKSWNELMECIASKSKALNTTAHFGVSWWMASGKLSEVDVAPFEFSKACFRVAFAGLRIASLPIHKASSGVLQAGRSRRLGKRDRVDEGIRGHVDLRQSDLRIFPPSAVAFDGRETNG